MKYGLRTKLSLSYILVTLVCVASISFLANILLEKQFKDYIMQNQERKNNNIVALVSQQYKGNGEWNAKVVENIGINALEQGMILKVVRPDGTTVWDANTHNSGMCRQMLDHMAHNMLSRYGSWDGRYTVRQYPIEYTGKKAGTAMIGYYGPYFYNDSDLAFINTLNRLLLAVGIFSLLFSLAVGAFMAKRLSTPITRVINTAGLISKGYYSDRSAEKSNTVEISQLITSINDLAETLEKQEILRKRLTADVAHELRTPLATLQSHLEAMIDGIWKPDTRRLKSCHEEIVRISRLVGDLGKLAEYEGENLNLHKSDFDVSELVGRIIESYAIEFEQKGVELAFRGEEQFIHADRDKISQVLINLITNALKYTPEGGAAEVSVMGGDDAVEISVSDSGQGIPAEDLPYIFERFYRADKSRNRMTGGAGIGLTISKAIVDAHKGSITVASELHAGTKITVSLPRSAPSS